MKTVKGLKSMKTITILDIILQIEIDIQTKSTILVMNPSKNDNDLKVIMKILPILLNQVYP